RRSPDARSGTAQALAHHRGAGLDGPTGAGRHQDGRAGTARTLPDLARGRVRVAAAADTSAPGVVRTIQYRPGGHGARLRIAVQPYLPPDGHVWFEGPVPAHRQRLGLHQRWRLRDAGLEVGDVL